MPELAFLTNWHFTKRDYLNIVFFCYSVYSMFEALQIFIYKFLLKWGKNEDFESSIFFEAQKYYFVFQMVVSRTLFRLCPTLWKSTLKMTLFWRWLTLLNSTLKQLTLIRSCGTFWTSTLTYTTSFQRWFDVMRLCDVIPT